MFNLTNEKRLVIISAEQAGRSAAANANASAELATRLSQALITGFIDSLIQCDGQYKGTPERSFAVICDREQVDLMASIAHKFDQECILVGKPSMRGGIIGALYFPNGSRERIGRLALCEQGRDYEASTTISGTDISFHFA